MPNNALGLTALTDMSKQLKTVDRAFANAVRANLRKGVKAAGNGVVSKVKANASWSSRIPGAVSLNIRYSIYSAAVKVQVDRKKAPHARPLELGNKNQYSAASVPTVVVNGRKRAVSYGTYKKARAAGAFSRTLRHPVYHKVGQPGGFAEQPTRPFFMPAILDSGHDIDLVMERVVIQTARDAGFK
jgi:hypothetical protein